jgi:hypothetical protein
MKRWLISAGLTIAVAGAASGALRVVESVPGADVDIPAAGAVATPAFTAPSINGVGVEARWTAVVADTVNGVAPWSADLSVVVTAPGGGVTDWDPVGGEVSIADYPIQDAVALGAPGGAGTYALDLGGTPSPFVAGLRDVTYHALVTAPDVVEVRTGTTEGGPLWDRPFSIVGVSGLGPVRYEALEFTVAESGLYVLENVLDSGLDHWASLYEGDFDPAQPLVNQLDYGLGNGNALNGAPRGTALIEALLFEGRSYTLVTSQWASFRDPGPYTLTITGPAAIVVGGPCPADLDGDDEVGAGDLATLIGSWGMAGGADLDGDGVVGAGDLAILIGAWGPCD